MQVVTDRASAVTARRVGWLFFSLLVLSVGVTLVLNARLGTDGYSTLINGITRASGLPFALITVLVGIVFVGVGWAKGLRPGLGTIAQPVVGGLTIGAMLPVFPVPESLPFRWLQFVLGFAVLCVGVAGYLGADLGIGPTEAPSIAFDPPVPYQWSMMAVQAGCTALGWLCGGDVGLGTLVVVFGIGPIVARLRPVLPRWDAEPAADLVP